MAHHLKLVSWNIWFDQLEQNRRYKEILALMAHESPSVICFQEVLPSFISQLKAFAFEYDYDISAKSEECVAPYGVLTLCKKELEAKFSVHQFPSHMSRKLLTAEVTIDQCSGTTVCIGNVHLESLDSQPLREAQLAICEQVLSCYSNAILCGDFNFCSYRNFSGKGPLENMNLKKMMPAYIDIWPELRDSSDMGYTFDTDLNPMIGDKHERMRYDRICYRHNSAITSSSTCGAGSIFNRIFAGGRRDEGNKRALAIKGKSVQIIGDAPLRNGVARPGPSSIDLDSDPNTEPAAAAAAAAAAPVADQLYMSPSSKTAVISSSSSSTYVEPIGILLAIPRRMLRPVPIFPSDHFGLLAEFEFTGRTDTTV